MLANDEGLYQKNLLEFYKLSNYNIKNDNENIFENENDENNENEIVITNFHNEINSSKNTRENNENYLKGRAMQMLDLKINYNLPDEDHAKNMNSIHLESVNKYIKIKALREEINHRIYNELKLKSLDKYYLIERISLLIPGEFLIDNKTLADYDLINCDYSIQAYITYNSINLKDKKVSQNGKNKLKKSQREVIIKKEIYISDNELVPIDLVPKLTKEGYKCIPSIMELSRKTAYELRNVENFKIFNKYGEVEFKEPINLLGVNLNDEVIIEKNMIDTKDKLNYWSVFKLYDFEGDEGNISNFIKLLNENDGKFISYKDKELIWEYKPKSKH